MALESFYGGKQGVSPVIKARFKYINTEDLAYKGRDGSKTYLTKEEAIWLNDALNTTEYVEGAEHEWKEETLKPFTMDECLKDPNYTDVWYGELCIIDTDNKMNPNNGKIYRRTLKQVDNKLANTADTLYAEYVGQIVGPSGGAPKISVGSLDNERNKALGEQPTYTTDVNLDNSNWNYSYPIDNSGTVTTAHPNEINDIFVLEANRIDENNIANIQMVPGKVEVNDEIKYNDHIRYTWCNVQRKLDDKNSDIWVYLGFEIPYTIYDVKGEEENYTYDGSIFIDTSNTQDGDKDHPFSKEYTFHIPRGTRGIGPEELFVVGKDGHDKPAPLYNFNAIHYQQNPKDESVYDINDEDIKDKRDWYYIPQGTEEKDLNSENEKTYWVAKWVLYNPRTNTKEEVYQYIGAYKDISGVQLLDEGQLQVQYSNSDIWNTINADNTLTWITSADVITDNNESNYGQFKITFNNTNIPEIDKNLHLIKDVTYTDETGKIKFDYSGNVTKEIGNIEYIKTLDINTNKDSKNYGQVLAYSNLDYILDNNELILKQDAEPNLNTILPLIKSSSYDEDTGIITFNYTNNLSIFSAVRDPEHPDDPEKNYGDLISYISKMKITDNGTLQYQLNTESGNVWHDITDGNVSPESLRIKDISNLIIKTPSNTEQVTVAPNKTAINGHLYVLYRGEQYYEDLGQVKTSPTVGSVLQMKNGNSEFFGDASAAITILNSENGYSVDRNTYVTNKGIITVKTEDKTGGFISFAVGSEEDKTVYLAYFDPIEDKWVNAGLFGGQSSINIKSYNPSDSSKPLLWDGSTEITFDRDPDALPENSKCPITNFPWQEF